MIGNKMKTILFSLVVVLLLSSIVSAVEYEVRGDGNFTWEEQEDVLNQGDLPSLDVLWVKIDGNEYVNGQEKRLSLERDQKIEIAVKFLAEDNFDDVTVEAEIFGNKHDHIVDASDVFDVENDTYYIKNLELELPDDMDMRAYDLRVTVAAPTGAVKVYSYPLKIDAVQNSVVIRDVIFNPSEQVEAGRSLLTVVRVKNVGLEDEDSVKIKVAIPELNLYAVDYIDELASDDSASSEEIYMRIPSSADSGDYDADVSVEYDDGYEETDETYTINVVNNEEGADNGGVTPPTGVSKIQITAGPQNQETSRGQGGVIYPVQVTNGDSQARSFSVAVAGVESFGTVKISPSTLLVIEPGQTETFYVYVSANEDATLGSHTFGVQVKGDSEVLKEFPLNVNVVEAEEQVDAGWDSVKKGLLVGLVVLIVLLVILGLIIAFNKMKGSEDEEDLDDGSASQTYY